MDAETISVMRVEDVLELPGFDPKLRALVELIDAVGPDVTLRDCANAAGADPVEWARRLIGSMLLAEVQRLGEAAAARWKAGMH
ncbi:hypothetical protein V5F59_05720 [Xanthobacter autotrophicus DSM 431]|uniref:hypothetical protein n=1 Tax=Xanthobacter nonsaccharivorans TaxID=3119912 RepID=UPI003726E850